MAISDDWTIDYTAQTIRHTSGTTVYEMYELYAWLMDEIDESGTIDEPVPMTAQTPTAYTITNGWFIDYTSIEFLTGGSLKTSGWENEIRMISYNANTTSFSASDIGETITGATTTDTGTVLDYDERYGTDLGVVWIRMDDSGDTFDNATEDFAVGGGGAADGLFTVTLDSGGSITGETIWANIYTLGTLVSNTSLYVVQDGSEVTSWWSSGHIDILLAVKEGGVEIDEGNVTTLARQYAKLYDHYLADLSNGSRTPIPLATFDDGNNDSGYRQMVLAVTNDTFAEGDLIQDDSDSTIQGVVTSYVSGTNTLQYYLVGSLTDFSVATGTFATVPAGGTGTAVNSTSVGPAATAGITITFTSSTQDLNNGNGSVAYDVTINCNSNTIDDVYEYLKYVTRRGSSTTFLGTGHSETGDLYIAVGEQYITYETLTNTFTAGNTVTGGTSGATATIVSDHGSTNLVITNIVGTFEEGENITEGTADADISTGGIENITSSKQSPFGTYAGGKFFGARGVWLSNVPGVDANNYQLIDSTGTDQIPPTTVAITVTNTESGDRVSIFRTTGDNEIINKQQFTVQQVHTAPVAYIRVLPGTVPADTPDTGSIRMVRRDGSGNIQGEEWLAFTAWTSGGTYDEFTLSGTTSKDYDTNDTAFVPYIDEQATGTSVGTTISYVANRYVLTRVRIVGMIPFKIKGEITTAGLTVPTIRASDTIYQ